MRTRAAWVVLSMGLGLCAIVSASVALAAEQRSYAGGRFAMSLDGASMGYVKSLEGGAIKRELAETATGSDVLQRKTAGGVVFEPFSVQVGAGAPTTLYDWIDAGLQPDSTAAKNVTFTECTADGKAVFERPASNGLITEVGFPAFDAQAKEAAYLTLKIAPESAPRKATSGDCRVSAGATEKSKAWSGGNFRFDLDGVNTTGVAHIDAFSVKRKLTTESFGQSRLPTVHAAALEIPQLTLSVARNRASEFERWAEDELVKGTAATSKQGAIVLLGPDQKEEAARVSLTDVRLVSIATDKDPNRILIGLSVDGVRFSVGGAKPKSVKSASAASAGKLAPASVPAAKKPAAKASKSGK